MSDQGVPEMEPNPDLGRPRPMCRTCGQVARCEYHIGVDDGYAAGRASGKEEAFRDFEARGYVKIPDYLNIVERARRSQMEADCAVAATACGACQGEDNCTVTAIRAAFDEKLKEASHE